LLLADTERVKAATASLRKNYFTSPLALTLLLQILTTHDSPQLRQLAAVEARSLVHKHWNSLPAEQKPQIRTSLLQSTLNEQTALVRHSSARVISAIAKIDLLDGEWADLPSFLQQAATSQNAGHREVGVYILYTLLETLEDGLTGKLGDMFALFGQTIRDPESVEVRVNTLLALGKIATIMVPEDDPQSLEAFHARLPDMVTVLKEVIQSNDEDRTMLAFEVFQTLLGCESSLLASHFKDLVLFMIELGASRALSDETRSQALSFLMQCVRYRKLKIQGLRLGEKLTLQALEIATEMKDLHEDEDEVTPSRSALGLLDMLAASLPPSQVIVPLLKALPSYINNPTPDYRRAGILALGMCVEGAPDFIATQMKDITPVVLRLLGDPEIRVRQAALHAFARLADDLADTLGEEHEAFIPALLKNLDSASIPNSNKAEEEWNLDIIKASCNAIDSFIEGIGKEHAASYLPELVPRFSRLIAHPDYKVKAGAAGAIGSIAAAAEDAFLPYFEATISVLSQYVTIKDNEEELDLRGVVCDTMGNIASAVGAEAFQPYVHPMMEASEQALHLGHPRLRETSYIFWSTMSKVYEAEFGHFLDGVVKGLFESLEQEETALEVELGEEAKDLLGSEITIAGKKIKVTAAGEGISQSKLKEGQDSEVDNEWDIVDAGGNGDSDEGDEDIWDELGAVTAVAAEKEIALDVLGDVLSHTKDRYLPYLEKTVEIVLGLVEHSYEGVRKAAIGTLWRAYACLWELCEDGKMGKMAKWQPGLPLKVQPTTELQKLGGVVMKATLAVYVDEVDR
jgi:importin-4